MPLGEFQHIKIFKFVLYVIMIFFSNLIFFRKQFGRHVVGSFANWRSQDRGGNGGEDVFPIFRNAEHHLLIFNSYKMCNVLRFSHMFSRTWPIHSWMDRCLWTASLTTTRARGRWRIWGAWRSISYRRWCWRVFIFLRVPVMILHKLRRPLTPAHLSKG